MEWLTEGNEIVRVRSPDMVSVLQHITLLIHINFLLNYMSVQQCATADPLATYFIYKTPWSTTHSCLSCRLHVWSRPKKSREHISEWIKEVKQHMATHRYTHISRLFGSNSKPKLILWLDTWSLYNHPLLLCSPVELCSPHQLPINTLYGMCSKISPREEEQEENWPWLLIDHPAISEFPLPACI